jgi:formamidopyrimidine-DNA glycosylase
MPELPDVEIARRNLQRWMRGAVIVSAHSTDRRVLRPTAPSTFRSLLVGRAVREVSRRGKWLRIELDDGVRLFSHLGMTGDWVARDVDAAREPSERARLMLSRRDVASSVRYVDPRRFGRLIAVRKDISEWRTLGRDPLADGLDARSLAAAIVGRRRSIKEVLMDQNVLAGIGNIIATEALWGARIDPRSKTNDLSPDDANAIARALMTIIGREIRHKAEGASRFRVYGRAGLPCPRCGAKLLRIVQATRGTTFCARCQVRKGQRAKVS